MSAARKAAPAPVELLWALLGLFVGLFLVQLLLATSLRVLDAQPPAVVISGVEALICTLIAGGVLIRPMQRWLVMERRRVRARELSLRRAAQRQEFSAELADALGHAVDETEARWVLRRAIDKISGDAPVELLLNEPGTDRLKRALCGGASEEGFGCPVRQGGDCPAIRSGQGRGGSSRDLDACRLLAERGADCHGLCLPVTINGRALGVLHTTRQEAPSPELRVRLQAIAQQAGVRLGLFRAMAASQEAASTDALTSLLNRRALSAQVAALDEDEQVYAVVIADIDHFKRLNDTHGHQLGDRALQVFAQALRESARTQDITARFGGEEFVIVLPTADAEIALQYAERVRHRLPRLLADAALPTFTASFGVADHRHGDELSGLIRAADEALYAAKAAGRDCTQVAPTDPALREVI